MRPALETTRIIASDLHESDGRRAFGAFDSVRERRFLVCDANIGHLEMGYDKSLLVRDEYVPK